MTKVNLTSESAIGLLRQSKIAGTQDKAIDLAIEVIEAMDIEIKRLKDLVTKLQLSRGQQI